jgi:acyl-CoA synthetase (AMP-forming)/AMP-acid ligase II
MIAFSVNQNAIWPVSPMRLINYFPINHIGCVIDVSVPALVAGGALIFIEQFDPHQTMALIGHERITVWGSVPSVFAMQLALPTFAQYDLSSLQLIVWGGAAMPQDLAAALVAIHPRLATNYGMTETSSAITALEPTADLELLTGSVGSAFPGVEVRLVNAQGGVPEFGEPGEVLARSRLNFLGYWRRPDATAEAFDAHGFFRTGDLASLRPDGRYRIVGRVKEMFKSGGYNVYPREVEAVLEAHPAVALVAVVAAPDPVWQEIGVAYVTPMAEVPPGELEAWCRERLANYKVPKRFVIEPDMPHLPIGKIDKMALKRRAAQPDPA